MSINVRALCNKLFEGIKDDWRAEHVATLKSRKQEAELTLKLAEERRDASSAASSEAVGDVIEARRQLDEVHCDIARWSEGQRVAYLHFVKGIDDARAAMMKVVVIEERQANGSGSDTGGAGTGDAGTGAGGGMIPTQETGGGNHDNRDAEMEEQGAESKGENDDGVGTHMFLSAFCTAFRVRILCHNTGVSHPCAFLRR